MSPVVNDPYTPDSLTGKVRIWDTTAKRYCHVNPIDARECINGVGDSGPTATWLSPEDTPKDAEESPTEPVIATEKDLMAHTRSELNAFCTSVKIDGEAFTSKGQCVEALMNVKFIVPAPT